MTEYRVAWYVELDADDPESAARKALAMQRDPSSTATYFHVTPQDEGETDDTFEIDLGHDARVSREVLREALLEVARGAFRDRGLLGTLPVMVDRMLEGPLARLVGLDPGHIYVTDVLWRDNGEDDDPKARLLAEPVLVVAGCPMHLEAWAVHEEDDRQVLDLGDDDLTDLHAAVHADGSFNTAEIGGREYVIVATPHS